MLPDDRHSRAAGPRKEWMIADFDSAELTNNVGGLINISEHRQTAAIRYVTCRTTFVRDDAVKGTDGHSLLIEYDLTNLGEPGELLVPKFAMGMCALDLSGFNTLNFYLKGMERRDQPHHVRVALSDRSGALAVYLLRGVTSDWRHFGIPFEKMKGRLDWTAVETFELVFDTIIDGWPERAGLCLDRVSVSQE